MPSVKIVHFSDALCVWAYIGQANLIRAVQEFGDRVEIDVHFCSVFPDTQTKISTSWRDRGGFHDDVWAKVQPRSSASPHLFIKAIELLENNPVSKAGNVGFADRLSVKAAAEVRHSFFVDAQDVSNWDMQRQIAEKIGLDFGAVLKKIETGEAIARLAADYELSISQAVQGSPTYILNEGRQRLFGNISYRILAANIHELLTTEPDGDASHCN
jgi:predicted DsbA family dithiol-disulfide isomerase